MESVQYPAIVVKSIRFKNGQKIEFNDNDIILLVGANNVGKSRTIKDLREDLINYGGNKVLIDEVDYQTSGFSSKQLEAYFEKNVSKDNDGNYYVPVDETSSYGFSVDDFKNYADNIKSFYMALFSLLTTENRLNLTRPISFNSTIHKSCLNIMKKLEENSEAILLLNQMLTIAFEKSIEVFPYYENDNMVKEYRIGKSEDINNAINANKRDSLNKLRKEEKLQDQGDGIRSVIAVLASLIINEHSLFLIDEPESFLHPPQAKLIGKNIVELSKDKQCFIATHNLDFIKGVVETDSSRVKIIKIDRIENTNTFSLIKNESISNIANDRNLKYTNILDGLFYSQLVLCENESDCKFYSALLENLDAIKYQNTLFCAVGGKHHFKKVIPLLKQLHIQYTVIGDIDIINNKDNLKQLLDSIENNSYETIRETHADFLTEFVENTNHQVKTQDEIKREINSIFTTDRYMTDNTAEKIRQIIKNISPFKLLKNSGKSALPQGDCFRLYNEIKVYLNDRNIYFTECGEIERFIPDIGGHGNEWLEKVFEQYKDINDSVYDEARKFVKFVFDIA